MNPELNWAALHKTKPSQYLVRFAFGGLISVGAAALGAHWGPGVGGLFLAFPAILPASLTLLKDKGGTRQACDDARGAVLGSLGLCAFALTVMSTGRAPLVQVLLLATAAWALTSVALWWAAYRNERP